MQCKFYREDELFQKGSKYFRRSKYSVTARTSSFYRRGKCSNNIIILLHMLTTIIVFINDKYLRMIVRFLSEIIRIVYVLNHVVSTILHVCVCVLYAWRS